MSDERRAAVAVAKIIWTWVGSRARVMAGGVARTAGQAGSPQVDRQNACPVGHYARPAARWKTHILLPVAAGALAVSTGIVVGVHVLGSAPPPSNGAAGSTGTPTIATRTPDTGPLKPDNRSAQELLLTAAEQTLNDPDPGAGRFWTATIEDGTLIQVGEPANRYAIMGAYTETRWVPPSRITW